MTVSSEHLEKMNSSVLVNLIQQAVHILQSRGMGMTAAETMAGELEDLQLTNIPGDGLANRADALDHEIANGGLV